MKDRVWYFATARTQGSTRVNANMFYNLNAGDATKWLYAPDLSEPGFSDRTWENISGRLTWQVTPRNKIGGFWDEQWVCRNCEGTTIGITDAARSPRPSAIGPGQTLPLRVPQVTWTSPVTNRLLLDAGFGGTYYGWGNFERDPNPDPRPDPRHRTVRGAAAPTTAAGPISSTARRTGATTAPARTPGRRRRPTSPARTASRSATRAR